MHTRPDILRFTRLEGEPIRIQRGVSGQPANNSGSLAGSPAAGESRATSRQTTGLAQFHGSGPTASQQRRRAAE
jgi:hypothetical protein